MISIAQVDGSEMAEVAMLLNPPVLVRQNAFPVAAAAMESANVPLCVIAMSLSDGSDKPLAVKFAFE